MFKPLRKSFKYTQDINGTPEEVFPLLCPKRESEWIEPWKCNILWSESGFAENDCVFQTNFPEDGLETWVVSTYQPNERIEFVRVCANRVTRHNMSLRRNEVGTEVTWEQVITALTPAGNDLISTFNQKEYEEEIRTLEMMLNFYLATGEMYRFDEADPIADEIADEFSDEFYDDDFAVGFEDDNNYY